VNRTAVLYLLALSSATLISCDNGQTTPTPARATALRNMGNPNNGEGNAPFTLAVIGDMPYVPAKLVELPDLIALINSDKRIDLVMHLATSRPARTATAPTPTSPADHDFGVARVAVPASRICAVCRASCAPRNTSH
jgi:hypothetical protein